MLHNLNRNQPKHSTLTIGGKSEKEAKLATQKGK